MTKLEMIIAKLQALTRAEQKEVLNLLLKDNSELFNKL